MGRYDRDVRVVDSSGDAITSGNPFPTTGSGGGGGGGTSQADKSTFAEGTTQITPIGGVRIDTLVGDVPDGKTAAPRITPKRALWATLYNTSGTEVGTASAPVRTDPTGTTAQPVTDNGGSLTVDDGGGSLTVDGAVAATQSGTWSVQLTDGSLTASVRNTGSNDSLNVAIVDASGNHITSFGGGTQYTEDDVDATPMGTVSMWWDDGDNSIHAASPTNPFPVTVVSGGGGGMVDDSPFTPGSDTVFPMGALFDDVSTDTVDEGDIGAPRMSGSRLLYVTSFAGSPVAVTDNGGSLTVDGTVSISGAVTVTGTVAATQSGSWTVTANAGSGTFTVDQADTASLDYDSGAGTVNQTVLGIALPGSGGPVAGGTATNPIRTDPTGTTAQPVTDNGGSLTVDDGGGSLTVDGTVAVSSVAGNVTVVQSTATNLKVDASGVAVPVTDNGGSLTVDGTVAISGSVTVTGTVAATQSGSWTVTANAGTGTFTVDQADTASLDYDSGAGTVNQTVLGIALPGSGGPVAGGTSSNPIRTDPTGTTSQPVTDGGGSLTVDGTVAVSSVSGNVTVVQSTATNLKVDASGVAVPVTDNGGSLTVDGTVAISGSVTVTGTVAATQSGSWTVTANAGTGTFTVDQADTASLDYDSGAGTVNQTVMGIALPGSGGPVAGGTSTNPVRIDPTGTTAQPVTDNGGTLSVDDGGGSLTVDAATLPLPTGASTESTLGTRLSESDFDTKIGSLTETAPATDTASSGLNGRLQRVAQRLTSLTALLPAALVSGRLDVNIGGSSANVTVVQATATNLKVDASGVAVPVTDNGSTLSVDDGGGSLTVDGTVAVSGIGSTVSTNNSTLVALGIGAVFTGTGEDVSNYAAISVNLFADAASAASGFSIQWSHNGGAWDHVETSSIATNDKRLFCVRPKAKFFRIVYTNGAVAQTQFRMQTIFHTIVPANANSQDGNGETIGKISDAVVVGDNTGTVSAKLRGINKILNSAWDSVNSRLKVDASAVAVPVTDDGGSLTIDGSIAFTDATGSAVVNSLSGSATVFLAGHSTIIFEVSGTWSGTFLAVLFTDTTFVVGVSVTNVATGVVTSSITENGIYRVQCVGYRAMSLTSTVWSSGSATITLRASVGITAVEAVLAAGTNNIGDVDVLSVVPGTGATSLGKAEDAAHTSGDVGVMALAVRNDTMTASTDSDGDYTPLQVDPFNRLPVFDRSVRSELKNVTEILMEIRDLLHNERG